MDTCVTCVTNILSTFPNLCPQRSWSYLLMGDELGSVIDINRLLVSSGLS